MIKWLIDRERGAITGETPQHDPAIRKALRKAFSGTDGQEALTYILTDLGFFDELRDANGAPLTGDDLVRASALRDYARRLLEQLGILHEANAGDLVKMLFTLPVWERKDD